MKLANPSLLGLVLLCLLGSAAVAQYPYVVDTEPLTPQEQLDKFHQPADNAETIASLHEFLPHLTAGEREFYEDHLAGRPVGGGDVDREPLSANARQLAHRIREKLLPFLGYGP